VFRIDVAREKVEIVAPADGDRAFSIGVGVSEIGVVSISIAMHVRRVGVRVRVVGGPVVIVVRTAESIALSDKRVRSLARHDRRGRNAN
jgi:hypothetical protein